MSTFITIQSVGLALDTLYHNSQKPKLEQKPIKELAQKIGISTVSLLNIKKVLVDMNLLIVSGEKRGQSVEWNQCKSKPNQHMLTEVYRVYTKDAKSRVKVRTKSQASGSLESALQVLVKLGYTGTIRRVTGAKGNVISYEEINLSKIKEEE